MEKKNIDKIIELSNELRWQLGDDFHDNLTESIYADAAHIVTDCVQVEQGKKRFRLDAKIDKIVTSKTLGFPIMFLILGLVLWLTIIGANYPSSLLANLLLDTIHPVLKNLSTTIHMPWWLDGFLIDGVYLAVAWVIAVMLPPMAIFFPMFT
jgi:ferrous iron transport protein B